MSILRIAGYVAYWIITIWLFCGIAIRFNDRLVFKKQFLAFARFVYHEVKPFFWPIALTHELVVWLDPNVHIAMKIAGAIITYLAWDWYKNIDDDDDRWKRRKQKLLEKVKVEAGKLVTVPVPA